MPVASSPSEDWLPLEMHLLASPTDQQNTHTYISFLLRQTWNGLALFAIVVIARHTARRFLAWGRGNTTSISDPSPASSSSEKHLLPQHQSRCSGKRTTFLSSPQPYRRLHYLFPPPAPPPFWMMDDQAKNLANFDRDGDSSGQGFSPRAGTPVQGGVSNDSGSSPRPRTEPTLQRYIMTRPPPPPPLTPPALSPSAFSRGDHGLYRGVPELDSSFIHQPNPDYLALTSPSMLPENPVTPPYASSNPMDIPAPLQHHHSDSSGSGLTGGTSLSSRSPSGLFSSNSLPTTSPFLPPAPPGHEGYPLPEKGVEVQGEVISVTDGYGTGWSRHTRVYGGGVCLACAASGGEGGFYGATAFRPSERG